MSIMRKLTMAGLLCFLPAATAPGAQAPAQSPPAAVQPSAAGSGEAQPQAAPAEAGKKEVTEFTLSPEKHQQAIEYRRAGYKLHFFNAAYGVLILLAVLWLGISARFRDWAEGASKRRFVQALIFVPLLTLTVDILSLPTGIYGQWLSLKYEQSVQGWGSWFWDWTKGELIGLVLSVLLLWMMYAIIRRSPRRWWFYFWLASIPIIILLLFITPVLIQPLFFQFEPLAAKQPQLVEEIEKVVARGGLEIPRERMFEMNASEKFKSINAYVTGFGASKRVVVWDTTLQRMNTEQTLYVFGHEMGHYVLGHISKTIGVICVLLLVFLYLGYRGMHWAVGKWGAGWGVRSVDDWASLPVFFALLAVLSFFSEPAVNTFSRGIEHEADIYGLEVTHGIVSNPQKTAAEAFQVLGEINLADPEPHPIIKVWLYNHPALNERLVFVRNYDPWTKGEPTQFIPK